MLAFYTYSRAMELLTAICTDVTRGRSLDERGGQQSFGTYCAHGYTPLCPIRMESPFMSYEIADIVAPPEEDEESEDEGED